MCLTRRSPPEERRSGRRAGGPVPDCPASVSSLRCRRSPRAAAACRPLRTYGGAAAGRSGEEASIAARITEETVDLTAGHVRPRHLSVLPISVGMIKECALDGSDHYDHVLRHCDFSLPVRFSLMRRAVGNHVGNLVQCPEPVSYCCFKYINVYICESLELDAILGHTCLT